MTALILACLIAAPQTLTARVVSIHDGDTITVLHAAKVQHKIRLASIDAPELKQQFGSRAKEALSKLVAGKDVRIVWSSKDRNGRIIGDVYAGELHVNREMIVLGMAWHYRQFSRSKELQAAEDAAREKRVGLWVDKEPTPPWDWRKKKS